MVLRISVMYTVAHVVARACGGPGISQTRHNFAPPRPWPVARSNLNKFEHPPTTRALITSTLLSVSCSIMGCTRPTLVNGPIDIKLIRENLVKHKFSLFIPDPLLSTV